MALLFHALIVLVLFIVLVSSSGVPGGGDIQKIDGYTFISKGKFGSALYSINAPNSVYTNPPLLMDLRGPGGFEQGFDMGLLLGKEFVENYNSLLVSLYGDEVWEPAVAKITNAFLDW